MPARRILKPSLTALAAAAASASLAGCLAHDPFAPPTDPQSAAARQVNEAAARNAPFPRWSEFPAAPTNVPTPEDFRMRVVETEEAERILRAQAAELHWTLDDTEGWATASRGLVDMNLARPSAADQAALTEAWAAEQRAKAVPPPITK